MLIVLSPAKTLDYDTPPTTDVFSLPDFIQHSTELVALLKTYSPQKIGGLMQISDALAALNAERFAAWSPTFTRENSKQAILAFNGDVYEGLDGRSLIARQLDYAQSNIRILSGLYGVLRPLDLMQPYRLEMGTKLMNLRGKDLYAFWGDNVTKALNKTLLKQKSRTLINLASEEYFKVVKQNLLQGRVITPVFEDWKNDQYKVIAFHAKRARGLMARYAAENEITQPAGLKAFDKEGYIYDERNSTENRWIFRRSVIV